jgi:ATP-binding cassette subfamily B (MDR/TAP) protein 1
VAQLTKENHFYDEYSRLLAIPYRSAMKRCHIIGVCFSVSDSVMYFTLAALFALGAFLVDQNAITFDNILL